MKTIIKLNLLLIACLITVDPVSGQGYLAFEKRVFIQGNDTLNYRILYPENMKPNKHYPLVLFLHGAGERGNDNQKQLTHGASLFLNKKIQKKYPAIVVFPQCPNNIMWTHRLKEKTPEGDWIYEFPLPEEPTKPAEMVNSLIDSLQLHASVDQRHTYVMGLSMGGIGTLEFLARWPQKYTAAISICGGHDPQLASTFCQVPIWFFHGGKDDVVPARYSRLVFEQLKSCNSKTRYTLYPDANHNSWDAAFAEPKLLKWLFGFKKKN
ncbi:dienelactone hydrolase family protein [Carboxylicivirga sp. A043]|uniref:carboxylesterase family protein n=1 Tax=Carboxylicivirga litoralis TaxID=2816963 RepID=UPI0021CB34DD|nr:alpha/beta hydrolase-fold protein [Carboxylicivirga sp. A043]MCU4155859.1 dienelactone hydrolase family protein [Carboxylicivirga sp. A043]